MSYNDPRIDLAPIGGSVLAYVMTMGSAMNNPLHKEANLSHAEVQLSEALHHAGLEFTQQESKGRYWLDFWFEEAKLAVEVDGEAYHDPDADAIRSGHLLGLGVRKILRFRAIEVFSDPLGCVAEIRDELAKSRDSPAVPPDRPVWARFLHRATGGDLLPATDAEKHDAILVLRDMVHPQTRHDRALLAEAHHIFVGE